MDVNLYKNIFSQKYKDQLTKHDTTKIQQPENPFGTDNTKSVDTDPKENFLSYLKENVKGVNESHKLADKMVSNVVNGKSSNIHEAMLALNHAEISFSYMVQVRNKALEAYQEVMRMQV